MFCLVLNKMNNKELVFNLLVHLSVLWCFLSLFFFLFVRVVEVEKIQSQIDNVFTPLVSRHVVKMAQKNPSPVLKQFTANFSQVCDPYDLVLQQELLENNWKVLIKTSVIGLGLIVFTVIWYLMFRDDIPLLEILGENLLVFVLIGIFEFIFFTKYALSYEPVSPREMGDLIESKNLKL